MVFSSFFENLKNGANQVFNLWPQKGQKFSCKKEAFDTPHLPSFISWKEKMSLGNDSNNFFELLSG